MSYSNTNKTKNGQFYTQQNVFYHPRFIEWLNRALDEGCQAFCEPFAGSNNIVQFVNTAMNNEYDWRCCDLEPEVYGKNIVPQYAIQQNDSLANFPKNVDVVITNPPYLNKSSATRRGLKVDFGNRKDLYFIALDRMLENVSYVAAIIPESFITSTYPMSRCTAIISLPGKMFDDTSHPVCLALFEPVSHSVDTVDVYNGLAYIGDLIAIKAKASKFLGEDNGLFGFKVASSGAQIGFRAVDNTTEPSIKFIPGEDIDESKINIIGRALTIISISDKWGNNITLTHQQREQVLFEANNLVDEYRVLTDDVVLTAFMGLRKDGKYRRRMDFTTGKRILSMALEKVLGNNSEITEIVFFQDTLF